MSAWWVLGHLLYLSAEDIREQRLSMAVILELGCTGIVYALYTGHVPQPGPGLILLCVAFFSREQIGYGDGWLMLSLGMWMTLPELLQMLFAGMGFGTVYAACLHRKEVPLVPFLTAACVIGEWI